MNKIKSYLLSMGIILVSTIILASLYVSSKKNISYSSVITDNTSYIYIYNIKNNLTNLDTINISNPLIENGTNMSFGVDLFPYETYEFTFDIYNSSSLNYKLSTFNLYNTNNADMDEITYKITYADGSNINTNDVIGASSFKSFRVVVSYNMPKDINSIDYKTYNFKLDMKYIPSVLNK